MANIYTRSTDGSDSDDGSTWALAKATLAGATAADVAGDTIYVSQSHAESVAGSTISIAGTPTSPSKILCAIDSAEPPTTSATSASVTTGAGHITITGSAVIKGITFRAGNGQSGSLSYSILLGTSAPTGSLRFEDCALNVLTTGTGAATVSLGDDTRSDATKITLRNTTVMLSGANQRVKVASDFDWFGGSMTAGATNPTSVFSCGLRGIGKFNVTGVDFSAIGTTFNLIAQPASGNSMRAVFTNCTLPASWAGSLWSATPLLPGQRAEMYNCMVGSNKLRLHAADYMGNYRDNETVTRTAGASDDGTSFSTRLASTVDAEYPSIPFEGPTFSTYVSSSGSSVTLTVEMVHDSQGAGTAGALQNDQIGIRVSYPGGVVSSVKADVLSAATDISTSTESWTTTGLTVPVKQKMTVSFTPSRKGEALVTVMLVAPSKIVYVCPRITVV